jgi:hypothetical protein
MLLSCPRLEHTLLSKRHIVGHPANSDHISEHSLQDLACLGQHAIPVLYVGFRDG